MFGAWCSEVGASEGDADGFAAGGAELEVLQVRPSQLPR